MLTGPPPFGGGLVGGGLVLDGGALGDSSSDSFAPSTFFSGSVRHLSAVLLLVLGLRRAPRVGRRCRPAALAGDLEADQAGRPGARALVGEPVREAGEHALGLAPGAQRGPRVEWTSVPARRSSTSCVADSGVWLSMNSQLTITTGA